jgi:predicted nucleic acid-binding protein
VSDHYVIDPSALMQGYVQEVFTPNVLALLEQVPDSVELHIPDFCLVECTNVLWKHIRQHGMPREVAQQTMLDLSALLLTVHPASAYLSDALTIGVEQGLAVYDSLYIALADAMEYPLITADGKQERKAMQVGVAIKPLTDFAPAG